MIVVTGATGNVGRPLVQSLASAGHTVTAITRGSSAGLPAHRHVTPVTADLSKPETLTPALTGAHALFLLVPGGGDHIEVPALLEAVAVAGARRVVLLSSQAVGTRPGAGAHAPLAKIEESVRESGLDWTILRPSGFASNALAWAPAVRAEQRVFAPYGTWPCPLSIRPTSRTSPRLRSPAVRTLAARTC